jgi:hypothetical protein
MKRKDPIIEEIHAFREEFAREHGHDVRRIARALQEEEKANHRKVVSSPPKRVKPTKKAS